MSEYTAYFRAEALGLNETLAQLQHLYSEARKADGMKVQIRTEIRDAQNNIARLSKEISDIQKDIDKKSRLGLDTSEAQTKLNQLKNELHNTVENKNYTLNVDMRNAMNESDKLHQSIKEVEGELDQQYYFNLDTSQAQENVRSLSEVITSVGDMLQTMGGALQSIGGMFGGDILERVSGVAVGELASLAGEGIGRSVSRYDILKTFPQYFEAVTGSAEGATDIVDRLNEAVLGLPTSLDEIVSSSKQYSLLLGDWEKGADLAISMNNALLAGGASESMKNYASYEILRLLTSGGLNTARQWNSLFNGLGASVKYIAEEMGYSDIKSFRAAITGSVSSGATAEEKAAAKELANQLQSEFIDALITAGQGEGIVALTEIYKDTVGSAIYNLRVAFSNLGASVIDELDSALLEYTGSDLDDTIVSFSDAIKGSLIPQIREWIQENPDAILDFLDKIKNYDWMGLIEKVGAGVEKYAEIMTTLLSAIPPDMMTFFIVWATPLGKALSAIGGGLKVLGGLKLTGALAKASGAGSLATAGQAIGGFVTALQGVAITALNIGVILGAIWAVGQIAKEFADVARDINSLEIDAGFGVKVTELATAITIIGTVVFGLSSLFAGMGTPAQLAFLAGEGLTGGIILMIYGVVETLSTLADAVKTISETDFPSSTKIADFGDTVKAIFDAVDVGDMNFTAQQSASISNLSNAIDALVGVGENLKELREFDLSTTDIGIAGDKARLIGKQITSIFETLKEYFDSVDMWGILGTSTANMPDVLTNMKSAIDIIIDIAQQFKDSQELLSSITDSNRGDSSIAFKTRIGVQKLVKNLGEIFTTIKESFGDEFSDLGLAETDSGYMDRILNNIQNALGKVKYIAEDMSRMQDELYEFTRNRTGGSNLWKVNQSVGKMIDAIYGIFENIRTKFSEGAFRNMYTSAGETDAMDTILTGIRRSINSIGTIARAIADVSEDLQSIMPSHSLGGDYIDPLQRFGEYMNSVLEGLDTAFAPLIDEGRFANVQVLHDSVWKIQNLVEALNEVQPMLEALIGATDSINSLVPSDGSFEVGGKLNTIFSSLSEAFSKISGDSAAVDIQAVVGGFSDLAGSIDTAEGAAGRFTEALGALKEALDEVKAAAEEARTKLADINTIALDAAVNAVNSVKTALNNAQTAATLLKNSLTSLPTFIPIRVSVQQTGTVRLPTNTGTVTPTTRASGGLINWARRGTDIVPAMLTPGEYVVKRSAVQAFGEAFMNRINSIDIDGAFRSLTLQAGASVRPAYAGATTNNYRDNHANVTQNIYTNNPNFANRRMSRFVKGL